MGFDGFQRYLSSQYASPATGGPLGDHAASDYASRLRRLERLLDARLSESPPKLLQTLAAELRHDPRLTVSVSPKRIGDIAVAVRAYAAYLSSKADAPSPPGAASDAPETRAAILAQARIGQGRFRADLLDLWQGRCPLTEVSSPELLRASHIKPWRDSTDAERLDVRNGLLLAVHLDALFDRALITFTDRGEMIVAKRLPERERNVFGLGAINRRLLLNLGHLAYLRHHRDAFDRIEAAPTPPSPTGAASSLPTA